jgi:hypothetical protein
LQKGLIEVLVALVDHSPVGRDVGQIATQSHNHIECTEKLICSIFNRIQKLYKLDQYVFHLAHCLDMVLSAENRMGYLHWNE